jgi:exonuclease V gamma subunit
VPYELDLDGVVLRGTLARVHRDGLRQFSASKAHGKTVLALGLDALAWSALGETAPVDRIVRDAPRATIEPLDAPVAKRKLRELIDFAARAREGLLPFAPKTGLEFARAGDADRIEAAARGQWRGDERQGFPGEGDDPWMRVALRGAEPFIDAAATAHLLANAQAIFAGLPGVPDAEDPGDAA